MDSLGPGKTICLIHQAGVRQIPIRVGHQQIEGERSLCSGCLIQIPIENEQWPTPEFRWACFRPSETVRPIRQAGQPKAIRPNVT